VFHFSVSLRYVLDVPCIADMMLLLFRWSTRFGDGFSMLLIVLLSLLVDTAMDDRAQPPPPTDAPNTGDPTGPLRVGDFMIEGVTEFS
jgi:hypothetical protein